MLPLTVGKSSACDGMFFSCLACMLTRILAQGLNPLFKRKSFSQKACRSLDVLLCRSLSPFEAKYKQRCSACDRSFQIYSCCHVPRCCRTSCREPKRTGLEDRVSNDSAAARDRWFQAAQLGSRGLSLVLKALQGFPCSPDSDQGFPIRRERHK